MLQRLEIKNIALIDNVSIETGKGFNVLTGETGAGKSIIIDSINAVIGERISKDIIRTGTDKALVEAVFNVQYERFADIFEDAGIEPEEDGTLVISREITLTGKNTCRVNGKLATVSLLKAIGERLVDMHGQYDNQSLLKVENHIDFIDLFGGEAIEQLRQKYIRLLDEYKEIKEKLQKLSGNKQERERKIDLIRYQIDEIKKARLKIGEEQELGKKRQLLSNSEKIITSLSSAYELLFSEGVKGCAYDFVNQAAFELGGIAKLDEKFCGFLEKLEGISYQIEDIAGEIRKERDNTEFSPKLLENIEERIDLIYNLKKKYGHSVEEIMNYCQEAEKQLEEMEKNEEIANKLQECIKKKYNELYETAKKINAERITASKLLEDRIGKELYDLEMKKARFKVDIHFEVEQGPHGGLKLKRNGLDRVEFLISTNTGEPLKPLSKIASGGEMSRIMLAIKTILADVDKIPVLIFDEIDNGISGKVSQKVGEKLAFLSRSHQVICVTHLAQIACMADEHFLIQKVSVKDSTKTIVARLSGKQVSDEIARILGGATISDITIRHAEEMLSISEEIKRRISQ